MNSLRIIGVRGRKIHDVKSINIWFVVISNFK